MTPSDDIVIDVRDLQKTYGPRVVAVDGLTLTVRRGEFFGIVGPNGAGKTTTLSVIEGLTAPTSGTVTVCGEAPWPRNNRLLSKLGVQLQSSALFERLTVIEEVRAFSRLFPTGSRTPEELVELVGLTEVSNRRQEKLSGGQRQRLMLATALVNDPEILILDEPTAGLDPAARRDLHTMLVKLVHDGMTVLYTSHDLADVERLCDRIAVLHQGRLIAIDSPTNLVAKAARATAILIAADRMTAEEVAAIPGVSSVELIDGAWRCATSDLNQAVARFAELGLAADITIDRARLEEVYLGLVEDIA